MKESKENKPELMETIVESNCKEIENEQIIIDNLIELADKRMYQAKNIGRNKITTAP